MDAAGRHVLYHYGAVVLLRCALSFLAGRSSVLRAGFGCRDTGSGVTEATGSSKGNSIIGTRFGT